MAEHGAEDWALSVGIGAYVESSGLETLPGALRDAQRFHDWVTRADGGNVPDAQQQLLLSPAVQDEEDVQPEYEILKKFLERIIESAAESQQRGDGLRAGRRLYLYLSGHGLALGGNAPNEMAKSVLLMGDARPPLICTHFAGTLCADLFRRGRIFDEVILVMDSCRTKLHSVMPQYPPFSVGDVGESRWASFLYGFAAANGKAAREIEVEGEPAGLFTSKLLELLEDISLRPLTAAQLAGRLFSDLTDVDVDWPRNPRDDFVLLEATSVGAEESFHLGPGDVEFAPLTIVAEDALALLHLSDVRGRILAEGRGRLHEPDLLLGSYKVRASLGKVHATHEVEHDGRQAELRLSPIQLDALLPAAKAVAWLGAERLADLPGDASALVFARGLDSVDSLPGEVVATKTWGLVTSFDTKSTSLAIGFGLPASPFAMCVPVAPEHRTEVFVDAAVGAIPDISVRVVPSETPVAEPTSTDRVRESLRLIHQHEGASKLRIDPASVRGDPVGALLALAHFVTDGDAGGGDEAPPDRLLRDEIVSLGASADVTCWIGGGALEFPPLLARSWAHAAQIGAQVVEDSHADEIAGRELALWPWLAWSLDDQAGKGLVRDVAAHSWPGWDSRPDPTRAAPSLEAGMADMGIPPSALQRSLYKAPPVERLVKHDTIAFVGASNDQLAAALAVAFVARQHRKWQDLKLYFLNDEALDRMVSGGRTGASLRRARDGAEREMALLLPHVAEQADVYRYDGLDLEGQWHFASLWDWGQEGGFVHVSPYEPGRNVRYTLTVDEEWTPGDPRPEAYVEAVKVYEAFAANAQHIAGSESGYDAILRRE